MEWIKNFLKNKRTIEIETKVDTKKKIERLLDGHILNKS